MTSKIVVSEKKLRDYREKMKTIGAWDKDYSSISKDLAGIKSNLIVMNSVYDIAGIFCEKSILSMRLLTYGDSIAPIYADDVVAILTPVCNMEHLTSNAKAAISGREISYVVNALSTCFYIIRRNELKTFDLKTVRSVLREMTIQSLELSKVMVGRALAIDYCLYRYDMSDLRDALIIKARKLIEQFGDEHARDLIVTSKEIFRSSFLIPSNQFGICIATLLNECNEGDINLDVVADFMQTMRDGIREHKQYDCLEFIDSSEFDNLIDSILDYHDVDREDEEDKD